MENQIKIYINGAETSPYIEESECKYKDTYKQKRLYLGSSDGGSLELESPKGCDKLVFGSDGSGYHAYVVDETVEIPSHYTQVFECSEFLKIKDGDTTCDGDYLTFNAEWIKIYRSGNYGCIIQLKSNNN